MRVGLDIGSTTIKCVVLNDAGQIVYSTYERHFSHILEKGRALLEKVAAEYLPDGRAYLAYKGKELTINQPQDAIKNGIAMLTEDRRATGILGVLSIADNVSIASLNSI